MANGWEYEIDENKNIHVQIGGNWCDYQLSYGLNDKGNIIYLIFKFLQAWIIFFKSFIYLFEL